jgi:hypothetical protein
MKVIAHEAAGVHLPTCPLARFGQRRQKSAPALIVLEDDLAPVASVHRVINRSGILDAHLPGHGSKLTGLRLRRQRI